MTCSSLTSLDMDASGDEVGERKTIWRDEDVGFFEPLDCFFFFFGQGSPIYIKIEENKRVLMIAQFFE